MVELLRGLQVYLEAMSPALKGLLYALSAIVMVAGILLVAISSGWKAKKQYDAKAKPGEIVKQASGASGIMALIVGIFMFAVGLIMMGAPVILGIVIRILQATGQFVPPVQPPAPF